MLFDPSSHTTSPATRPDAIIRDWYEQRTGRLGITVMRYEVDRMEGRGYESATGWNEFECRCGERFWRRKPLSLVKGCGGCGDHGGRPTRDLVGQRYGRLTVVGHERGKGWVLQCRCGRTKIERNTTALANGALKSCGKCRSENPEDWPASLAPPSAAVAAAVVAGIRRGPNEACIGPDDVPDVVACAADHARIAYSFAENEAAGGCPLCIALARIELLS